MSTRFFGSLRLRLSCRVLAGIIPIDDDADAPAAGVAPVRYQLGGGLKAAWSNETGKLLQRGANYRRDGQTAGVKVLARRAISGVFRWLRCFYGRSDGSDEDEPATWRRRDRGGPSTEDPASGGSRGGALRARRFGFRRLAAPPPPVRPATPRLRPGVRRLAARLLARPDKKGPARHRIEEVPLLALHRKSRPSVSLRRSTDPSSDSTTGCGSYAPATRRRPLRYNPR